MPKAISVRKYDYFRALLLDARKRASLTQSDLADRLDKPQSFVSKYESGERQLDVLEFLEVAAVLDLDVAGFLKKLSRDGSA